MKGPALLMIVLSPVFLFPAWASDVELRGNVSVTGSLAAEFFIGSGAGLTGIPGSAITNVTSGQIADNAVTEVKLSNNSVTPSKLAFHTRMAIVAASGGDYNDPAVAMAAHADWCTSPSSSHPCLLKIMPGVYTVASSLQMQPYVDIEGSGENTTIIQGSIASSSAGTVNGASHAEIRFLTVRNTGGGTDSYAIYSNSASPKMTNVTASASGGTTYNCGVFSHSAFPVMTNVTASGSGGTHGRGVYNYLSSPVMTSVVASASGGASSNMGVYNFSSSPVMTNVTATASEGDYCSGISNSSSSPMMINVIATASDGTDNRGVNNSSSSPVMINVTASASGGTHNYGVRNATSGTASINHSLIKGSTNTIYNGAGVTTLVGDTKLDGGPAVGPMTCIGAYDESYEALSTACN
jgi:hypothetical protein